MGRSSSGGGAYFIDTPSIDAFGRARVAEPTTLFDSKQIFDNAPLFFDDAEESGGGTTSTHSTATASTVIGVAATTAGKRTRQTFQRFNYQPGKSQLVLTTFTLGAGTSGVTKEVGYFDDNNGIFLQQDGTTLNIVKRSKVTGVAVDTAVAQASWNLDVCDGTGESGVNIDVEKAQIFFIDFEWLGVGRVRTGFVVDGLFVVAHEFLNANVNAGVYMSTPNLPIRYSIENDGTGDADTFEHICCSVVSEGGTQDLGVLRYASTAGTHLDAASENVIYAILGIRLKSTHLGQSVKIINTALQIHTATEKCEWLLILNPTIQNTFTFTGQTNSGVEIATGGATNTVTAGTIITGGYIESGGSQSGNAGATERGIENAINLGAAIDGTQDEIILCIRPLAGSADVDVEGSITWRELT